MAYTQREKTLEETYDSCLSDGFIENIDISHSNARTLMENAKTTLNSANAFTKTISKNSKEWQSIYTLTYDAIRMLAESLLAFDGINSKDDKCLFSALCIRHPELDFEWGFFEKIRAKINDINEEGLELSNKDFKEVELQMKLYIMTLTKEIEKKLAS